jgi:hypothetical protein
MIVVSANVPIHDIWFKHKGLAEEDSAFMTTSLDRYNCPAEEYGV